MEWAWLAPVVTLAAFVFILVLNHILPKYKNKIAYIGVAAIFLGFLIFCYVLFDMVNNGPKNISMDWFSVGTTIFTLGIIIDPLSVTMLGLVTLVAFVIQVYSLEYMRGEIRYNWYFAIHSMFAAAMLTLILADNLILAYISWELVGLGSYLLIGFWYEKREAAEAAKKAFITTRIADVGLLIGIILLFKATGSFELSTIFDIAESGGISQGTLTAATLLIFIGAMGKSAQFPFHIWLPDAMEGPTPVSALIHAATMVAAGVFLIARLFPLFELAPIVVLLIAIIGITTTLIAGSIALVMTDLKKILAYSTISHLGFMMVSIGAFGVGAAIFHLLIHAFSKALLFLSAGSITHGTKETDILKMRGIRKRMPITTFSFAIGILSLAGIPPLSGFFSKEEILLSILSGRNYIFIILALLATLLSASYMARLFFIVVFGKLAKGNEQVKESPLLITVPLILLALFTMFLGLLGFIITGWSEAFNGLETTFHVELGPASTKIWITSLSIILVTFSFILGYIIYFKEAISSTKITKKLGWAYKLIKSKYYIDEILQFSIGIFVIHFSEIIAKFDRLIINDAGVNGLGNFILKSGNRLRFFQTGQMYSYASGMILGVIALVIIWEIILK